MSGIIVSIGAASIVYAVSILYAAIGEIFSEKAGVMNFGLEGMMLMGAASGFVTAYHTHSLFIAMLVVISTGILMGVVYSFLTVTLQADQTVCGMAYLTFGAGLSGFIGKKVAGLAVPVKFHTLAIPGLCKIPFIGPIFFKQNLLVYIMYILLAMSMFYLYKTRYGMILRALGENPKALDSIGINVFALRYIYVTLGCILTAVSGACISLAYTNFWTEGMTGGKGWIAFSLVAFSGWNPVKAALGAILFGAISIIGINMQVYVPEIPSQIYSMLPYAITIIAFIISTANFRNKVSNEPAALCKAFDREKR